MADLASSETRTRIETETERALRALYALDEHDLPFEDDEPMAENDYQLDAMVHSFGAFKARYVHRDDV